MKTYVDEEIRKLHCTSSGFQGPVQNLTMNHMSPPQPMKSDEETTRSIKPINSESTSSSPSMNLEHEKPGDLSVPVDESVGNNEETVHIDLLSHINQFIVRPL